MTRCAIQVRGGDGLNRTDVFEQLVRQLLFLHVPDMKCVIRVGSQEPLAVAREGEQFGTFWTREGAQALAGLQVVDSGQFVASGGDENVVGDAVEAVI
jgi:hypothetical protein